MTEEQIIKAFEEMAEDNRMPIINQCICSDVLNLINRQKAEIERWKMVIEQIENDLQPLPFETNFEKAAKRIKSEAIKEFAERLKKYLCLNLREGISVITADDIDKLVKEMTEVEE